MRAVLKTLPRERACCRTLVASEMLVASAKVLSQSTPIHFTFVQLIMLISYFKLMEALYWVANEQKAELIFFTVWLMKTLLCCVWPGQARLYHSILYNSMLYIGLDNCPGVCQDVCLSLCATVCSATCHMSHV